MTAAAAAASQAALQSLCSHAPPTAEEPLPDGPLSGAHADLSHLLTPQKALQRDLVSTVTASQGPASLAADGEQQGGGVDLLRLAVSAAAAAGIAQWPPALGLVLPALALQPASPASLLAAEHASGRRRLVGTARAAGKGGLREAAAVAVADPAPAAGITSGSSESSGIVQAPEAMSGACLHVHTKPDLRPRVPIRLTPFH